jgi:hypothetical protein
VLTWRQRTTTRALAHKNVDHLVDEIVALRNADKIRLLSRLMEAEGTEVDWAMIKRTQRQLPDTAALRREISKPPPTSAAFRIADECPQLHVTPARGTLVDGQTEGQTQKRGPSDVATSIS